MLTNLRLADLRLTTAQQRSTGQNLHLPSVRYQPRRRRRLQIEVEDEVEVNLRLTDSRPVCLGVRHPTWTRDQFLFLLEIFFRQLRVAIL
jgi:hypothetical protein